MYLTPAHKLFIIDRLELLTFKLFKYMALGQQAMPIVQVTIPMELRRELGLDEGDLLEAKIQGKTIVLKPQVVVMYCQLKQAACPRTPLLSRQNQHPVLLGAMTGALAGTDMPYQQTVLGLGCDSTTTLTQRQEGWCYLEGAHSPGRLKPAAPCARNLWIGRVWKPQLKRASRIGARDGYTCLLRT
jgi:Regulators of stationary/sporulation gene expression